jgi:hypothetical protein
MTEGLQEVTQQLAAGRINLLGKQADVIGIGKPARMWPAGVDCYRFHRNPSLSQSLISHLSYLYALYSLAIG